MWKTPVKPLFYWYKTHVAAMRQMRLVENQEEEKKNSLKLTKS